MFMHESLLILYSIINPSVRKDPSNVPRQKGCWPHWAAGASVSGPRCQLKGEDCSFKIQDAMTVFK